jgi:NADH-quinone oxidoreductase subunit D
VDPRLIAELQRINSHLVWLGTHAMDLGAVSVMLYCFRERELLLNINEAIAGFRMFPSYIRIGGLREDLPRGFHEQVRELLERMPKKLGEYEDLLTGNPIFVKRTTGVGLFKPGAVLPVRPARPHGARGRIDIRRAQGYPYCGYETFDFEVPTYTGADVFDRYRARIREMHESVKISLQALDRITPRGAFQVDDPRVVPPPKDKVYTEMEALIQHFLIYSQGFTVPSGEAFVPVEGPRGEHGVYVVSDGTNRPVRVHLRPPSLLACQAMEPMVVGALIAGRRRHHRLDRHRHGRRGPVSFHPEMPYAGRIPEVRPATVTRGRGVRLHTRAAAEVRRSWRRITRPSSASRPSSTRSSWCRNVWGTCRLRACGTSPKSSAARLRK